MVIGKKGEDIEVLKSDLCKLLGVQMVHVNIEEIRKPEVDAQLIADSITQQLEKRIMFRRAMKRAMQNAMRLGAQGIKIMSAGRLNGIEIARTEWYREGRVPLHTLRADIDYGVSEAKTTYGVIGVKVWVYKGEVMAKPEQPAAPTILATEEATAKKVRKAPPRIAAQPAGGLATPSNPAGDTKPKPARKSARKSTVGAASTKKSEESSTAAKTKATVKRVGKAKEEPGSPSESGGAGTA